MATLVTRSGKGSPLTHAEVDANFTNLNTDKLELSGGTMTGNLEVQANATADGIDLSALAATISDTAVDIFVYDTRKDSDGGAWRKRTQHTSWYNETLNTSTRGSRKEFPAVAVIVAENGQVTIYDGDDPDLPMWMVFNVNQGILYYTYDVSSIFMLNGVLAIGRASTYGVGLTNFISDASQNIRNTFGTYTYNGGIADRNSSSGQAYDNANPLVANVANDVAMTVLPNAPIDAATGLPVPTIAVATDGGVSVIKDDGTVVDSSATTPFSSIDFLDSNKIVSRKSSGAIWTFYPYTSDGFGTYQQFTQSNTAPYIGNNTRAAVALDGDVFLKTANGSTAVQSIIAMNNSVKEEGMAHFFTTEYATGWQQGDIKLATLSDTDDTDVTGSELVTNGTFDTDLSSWSDETSVYLTPSWNSGKLRLTWATYFSNWYGMEQFISTEVGKTYVISADMTSSDSSASGSYFYVYLNGSWTGDTGVANGVYTRTFVAQSTSTGIRTGHSNANGNFGSGDYYEVDNVSVRLAEEDRSVNGNGLQVFGTVTKNPVATGADLVAYSGFSSSNRLTQPYNSDLDFGTGDFSITGWIKIPANTNIEALVCRTYHNGSAYSGGGQITTSIQADGTIKFEITDDSWNTRDQFTTSGTVDTNTWQQFFAVRRGSTLELWLNGEIDATSSVSNAAGSLSNSDAVLHIGMYRTGGIYPLTTGSIALARISATAPSPEQIKKIYEDEKRLFQENAQATLYGDSETVNGAAYDKTTGLLHIGTSEGRSVFQGLRRVDNTTTAVGAAISASGGLVADE
jgi:hypothetical protein